MQATCGQCAQLLAVDDAKAPPKAFTVKCPKCGAAVQFPGREATPNADASHGLPPLPPPRSRTLGPGARSTRSGPAEPQGDLPPLSGRVLVAVPKSDLASAVASGFTRLGFTVDISDDWEGGARLVDQGVYDYAVTVRAAAAPGKGETLYQRILRMPADVRRSFFVVLAGGEEFKTGDGTQAFASLADFVLNGADIPTMEPALRNAIDERTRLYQPLRDAKKRIETAV